MHHVRGFDVRWLPPGLHRHPHELAAGRVDERHERDPGGVDEGGVLDEVDGAVPRRVGAGTVQHGPDGADG